MIMKINKVFSIKDRGIELVGIMESDDSPPCPFKAKIIDFQTNEIFHIINVTARAILDFKSTEIAHANRQKAGFLVMELNKEALLNLLQSRELHLISSD